MAVAAAYFWPVILVDTGRSRKVDFGSTLADFDYMTVDFDYIEAGIGYTPVDFSLVDLGWQTVDICYLALVDSWYLQVDWC